MGQGSLTDYLTRIKIAYISFINPHVYIEEGFLPAHFSFARYAIYYVVLFAFLLLSVVLVINSFKKGLWKGVVIAVSCMLLPCAISFIFVMSDIVNSTMMYSCNSLFLSILLFTQLIDFKSINYRRIVAACLSAIMLYVGASFIYYDNECLLKAQFLQDHLYSNYTTLITRIKSVEGYNDEMAVSFVNIENYEDLSLKDTDYPNVKVNIYEKTTKDLFLEPYNYQKQIAVLTGFSPEYKDSQSFSNNAIVQTMPSYPDDGSIRVIDDTVVVKF